MTNTETPAAPRNTEEQFVRPDIDPGNAYRRLMPSDVLRDGDEYWCNGEWFPTGDAGYLASELPYRRLREGSNHMMSDQSHITEAAPTTPAYLSADEMEWQKPRDREIDKLMEEGRRA